MDRIHIMWHLNVIFVFVYYFFFFFFFQAEDGIRDAQESRGLGDVYKRQEIIIKNDSENWILNTEIIETNIIDEKNIHVKIFH